MHVRLVHMHAQLAHTKQAYNIQGMMNEVSESPSREADNVDNHTLRIKLSLKTKFVMLATKMKRAGKTAPHRKMMPYGSGSSTKLVIWKPVMSSTENKASKVCKQ